MEFIYGNKYLRTLAVIVLIIPSILLVATQAQGILMFHSKMYPSFPQLGILTAFAFESVYGVLALVGVICGAILSKKAKRIIFAAEVVAVLFSALAVIDVLGISDPVGTAVISLLPVINILFLWALVYISEAITSYKEKNESKTYGKSSAEVDRMVKAAYDRGFNDAAIPRDHEIENNRAALRAYRSTGKKRRSQPIPGRKKRGRPSKEELMLLAAGISE